jgi:class 3 adenylate cyclase
MEFSILGPVEASSILGSAAARWLPAPDYPCGEHTGEMADALRDIAANRWGQGDSIDWYLPSRAGSPHARELFARFERLAVTPGAFLRLVAIILDIDVRAVLPAIHVPTLVIQRLGDRITPPCHGRYLASRIAGARYFEQPGDHSLRFAGSGDSDALFQEISAFLAEAAARPQPEPEQVLVTILVAALAAGTETGQKVQDHGAQDHGAQDHGVQDHGAQDHGVRDHGGRLLASSGDRFLATFGTPGQAIRCAQALRLGGGAAGSRLRCGIHTGEVAMAGEEVAGTAVLITQRLADLARPGQILVSRTVRDLVAGSGHEFTDQGSQRLDEPAERWHLYAVDDPRGGR